MTTSKEQLRKIVREEIRKFIEARAVPDINEGIDLVSDYASFMKQDMRKNPGEWSAYGDDLDKVNTKDIAQKMIDKALKNGAKTINLSNNLKKALKKNGFAPNYSGLEDFIAKQTAKVRGTTEAVDISEATPSKKAPEIDDYIKNKLGIDRVSSIQHDKCAICGRDATKFKDKDSEREYSISGMCQHCQDKFFD